jgi:membrane fusion protein, multidrug efflux system
MTNRFRVSPPRVALVAALIAVGCTHDNSAAKAPTTLPVVVATVRTATVPIAIFANGTVEPLQTVALQARVSGPVLAVHFTEGEPVTKGQLLFEIDPMPYRNALDAAKAALARDRASATAARRDAARYAALVAKDYVTQSQADQQTASADALMATVSGDEATVRTAELNLSYASVRAPIDGQTGNLNVRVGNQVNGPTGPPLVVINAVTPVHVRFPVPERTLAAVRDAQAKARGGIEVVVRDSSAIGTTERGTVDFIDNAVDSVTGTAMIKARFANADRKLWPGAFVPVSVTLGETAGALVIPSVAVQQGPSGAYVFMPDASGKARQVAITIARSVGDLTVISKGVAIGDRVVVDGQSRLYAGAPVTITKTIGATRGDIAPGTDSAVTHVVADAASPAR